MASGGARGNAGRVADPNALRRDRAGDAASWVTLEPRSGEVPEFPLESATGRELVLWERLWGRPQASEWERLFLHDEVALYVRYLVEAEQPDASSAVRTLVKQHQELLGLSTVEDAGGGCAGCSRSGGEAVVISWQAEGCRRQ